jgi:hypothetical protein
MERTMYDWAAEAAAALGLPADAGWVSEEATVREVLDVAREVAQGVARPAAPVGAFLAGVAVGLAGAGDRAALEDARARLAPTLQPAEP